MTTEKIVKHLKLFAKRPKVGDSKEITDPKAYHFALGNILGDGSIHKQYKLLEIEQKSATYAFWKRNKAIEHGLISIHSNSLHTFRFASKTVQLPLTVKNHKVKLINRNKTKKPFYRSFSFSCRAVFHDPNWRDFFYEKVSNRGNKQYRKKLPGNIKDLFYSPYALAIWYLDDGFYDLNKNTVRLSVGEWTRTECLWMQECLEQNFGIQTSVYSSGGVPHHLYVKLNSYAQFYSHVNPTVQELLRAHPKAYLSEGLKTKVRLKSP